MSVGFKSFHQPIKGKSFVWIIRELISHLSNESINLNPEYQREIVWNQTHQEDFMGFWLEGGTVPTVFLRELSFNKKNPNLEFEVVDGKQRCTSLIRWWNNEIPARLSNGHTIWRKDFDEIEIRQMNILTVPVTIVEGNMKEILDVYLKLNRGIGHSQEELDRVRSLRDSI